MPVRLACPNCGTAYNADAAHAGRRALCRYCNGPFSISGSQVGDAPDPGPAADPPGPAPAPTPPARSSPAATGSRRRWAPAARARSTWRATS